MMLGNLATLLNAAHPNSMRLWISGMRPPACVLPRYTHVGPKYVYLFNDYAYSIIQRERRGIVLREARQCRGLVRLALRRLGFDSRTRHVSLLGVKTWQFFYLCLSEETLKAVGPFYPVSMPGEVQDPTQGKTCRRSPVVDSTF